MKAVKFRALRGLVKFREFANTERGERIIVRTLTGMSIALFVDVALLVLGSIMS